MEYVILLTEFANVILAGLHKLIVAFKHKKNAKMTVMEMENVKSITLANVILDLQKIIVLRVRTQKVLVIVNILIPLEVNLLVKM